MNEGKKNHTRNVDFLLKKNMKNSMVTGSGIRGISTVWWEEHIGKIQRKIIRAQSFEMVSVVFHIANTCRLFDVLIGKNSLLIAIKIIVKAN